jgi:hypothetical protein
VTGDEIREAALQAAQELLGRLQDQDKQLHVLAAMAEIIEFARSRLEPLARKELEANHDEIATMHSEAIKVRDTAWEKYAPAAASLAALEGKLAQARAYEADLPDLESPDTTLEEWRAADARQRANEAVIAELEERIPLMRSAMHPMEVANARCRDAVEKAATMLRETQDALAKDDVFSHPAGRATAVYGTYLLHSGLWRGDPNSPIGMAWLRKSGKGAEIEARIEEGVRADERARGPRIRSAPSAHPLWEATSGPGFAQEGRTGPWEVNPGIPGHPPDT